MRRWVKVLAIPAFRQILCNTFGPNSHGPNKILKYVHILLPFDNSSKTTGKVMMCQIPRGLSRKWQKIKPKSTEEHFGREENHYLKT